MCCQNFRYPRYDKIIIAYPNTNGNSFCIVYNGFSFTVCSRYQPTFIKCLNNVMGKVKRSLSILLAIAMVITMMPQTGMTVYAGEGDTPEIAAQADEPTQVEPAKDPAEPDDPAEAPEKNPTEDPVESDDPTETPVNPEEPQVEDPVTDPADVIGDMEVMGSEPDVEVAEDPEPETVSVSVVGGLDGTGYTVTLTGGVEATKEQAYKFTVKPKEFYKIVSVKYSVAGAETQDVEFDAVSATEKEYEIEGTKVTGNITITVKAEKKTHSIKAAYANADSEGQQDADKDNVIISLGAQTVTGDKPLEGVEEGANLTFTVKLNENAKATRKISSVKYKVGTSSDDVTIKKDSIVNGSWIFTIAKDAFGDDVTITVTTEAIPDRTFKFTPDASVYQDTVAKITDIKVGGKDYATKEYSKTDGGNYDNWTVAAKVGQKVSFKITAAEFFKVTQVTGEDGIPLTPDKSGVYSFTVEDGDANTDSPIALNIKTELNAANAYTFKFEAAGDKGSVTVKDGEVAWAEDATYNADPKQLDAEGKLVTRNGKVTVTLTVDESYELVKVESIDGKTAKQLNAIGEESNKYEVDLTAKKTIILRATTKIKADNKDATVTFTNAAGSIDLTGVKVDGVNAVKAEGEDDTYKVPANSEKLEFTLVAAGPYKPVFTKSDVADSIKISSESLNTKTDKTTYTCYVLASKLKKGDSTENIGITIEQEADEREITITGAEKVDVVKSINGKKTTATEVSRGTAVTFQVTAKDNYNLTAVSANGKAQKISGKKTSEFTVTVNTDTAIAITTEGLYIPGPLLDESGEEVTAVKNVYSVSYDGKYSATLKKGDGDVENLSKVRILNSKKNEIATGTVAEGGKKAVIDLSKAIDGNGKSTAAGNKLTVELYVKGNNSAVATYSLSATKVVSKINLQATATQAIDTVKDYSISTDGEIDRLDNISISDKSIITKAEIDGGKLWITTAQAAKTGTASVTVTDKDGNASKTIKVTTKALISPSTAKPSVKLKAADDISLTLTVGSKNIDTANTGEVYYKVIADPGTTTDDMQGELKKSATTVYEKRTDTSQDIRVPVAESEKELGDGGAWTYDVTVSLVHMQDKNEAASAQIVKVDNKDSISAAFEAKGKKGFSTLKPAYETALKLKKSKNTTIYTGQKNVVIATPQFSKATTYRTITKASLKDISYEEDTALQLDINENGDIIATATDTTAVAKHTVQVTAAAATDMNPSTATIVITVVQRINDDLKVSVPSLSLYKAPKKAASVKATPIYNDGVKSKKVKWEVVKEKAEAGKTQQVSETEGSGKDVPFTTDDSLYGMININQKNGTFTINKNYTLALDDKDNTFVIKAIANDFDGNEAVGYSDPITITNEGLDVDTVGIVKEKSSGSSKTYEVIALPNGKDPVEVEASELQDTFVAVFTSTADGLEKGKTYENESAFKEATLPDSNLSFKSSSAKNIAVNPDNGAITVIKPANKVKLTATANDGTKASATLQINVIYDKTAKDALALKISLGEVQQAAKDGISEKITYKEIYDPKNSESDAPSTLEKAKTFAGSTSSILKVEVMAKNTGSDSGDNPYIAAPAFTNYKLAITGGKPISQEGSTAYFAVDSRAVKLTLTDNGSTEKPKPSYPYFLTNTVIPETTTGFFTPKAAAGNKLYKIAAADEQKVTINLSNVKIPTEKLPTEDSGEKVAAKVEVDFSAMNSANREQLLKFASLMEKNVYEFKEHDSKNKKGNFVITFKDAANAGDIEFDLSSYKLKVTVGTYNESETKFTPLSNTVVTTVSVDKIKTFTYKPTTSYTIYTRDSNGVALAGKPNINDNVFDVSGYALLNANINGVANNFKDLFEVDAKGMLKIKHSDAIAPGGTKTTTGYLTYTAKADKPYYSAGSGMGTNTVKITVTVNDKKTAAKYAVVSQPVIEAKKGSKTDVAVKVNGTETKMKYAMVDGTSGWEAEAKEDGKVTLTYKADNTKDLTPNSSCSVKLRIVPEGSCYENDVANAKEKENNGAAYEAAMKQYGVSFTVTVKVNKLPEVVAKEALEKWLKEASKDKAIWLTNNLKSATELIAVITNATEEIGLATDAQVAAGTNYKITPATLTKTGSITGDLKVTVDGAEATASFSLTIPAKAITKDEAASEISKANIQNKFELTNEDLNTNKAEKQKEIVAAAQNVIGDIYYTVTADSTGLNGTEASESDSTASITLEIKEKGNSDDTAKTVTIDGFVVKKGTTE